MPKRFVWSSYVSVLASKAEPIVNPKHMASDKKRQLWEAIKTKRPGLADLMVNNADIAALKEMFGAEIVFATEELDRLIGEE
jgi:short-subunit dehydrogenase involved in D-alanine esterification of teichoic acids